MIHYNFEHLYDEYSPECRVYLCPNENYKQTRKISIKGYIKKTNISLILGPMNNKEDYTWEINIYDDTKGIFIFMFKDKKIAEEEFIKLIQDWNL